jgi:hypothetical protein
MARKPINVDELAIGDTVENRLINKQNVAVLGAGDGLSKALKIEQRTLHADETVYVLIETKAGKLELDPYEEGLYAIGRKLHSQVATIVDESFAKETIERQRAAMKAADDAAKGQGDFLKLAEDHDAGLHDTPEPACPQCKSDTAAGEADDEWEAAARAVEAATPGAPKPPRKRGSRRTKATTADESK